MEEVKSPCIKVCQHDSKGICFGCRRTVEESGNWSNFTNEEREAILKELPKRSNVRGESPTVFLR